MTREAETFFRFAMCSPTDANWQVSAGISRRFELGSWMPEPANSNRRTGKFTSSNRQKSAGSIRTPFITGRFITPPALTEAVACGIPMPLDHRVLSIVTEIRAFHPRIHAGRGGLLARALVGTRSSRPSRRRVIPSPCPVLDALATRAKGQRWDVENAERPALNPETYPPPWPFPSHCPIRPRSEMGWRSRGRAQACGGSLGPAGGVLAVHGPLDRSRDRGRAGGFRSRRRCLCLRVSCHRPKPVSFHNPTPTGTLLGRAA